MHLRKIASLIAVAAALGAPATALAQSAGDDQYSDPFAGDNGGSSGSGSNGSDSGSSGSGSSGSSGSGSGSPGSSGSSGSSSSGSSGSSDSSGAEATAAGTTASADAGPSLARTGAETGILALGGISLLLAGVALRLRLREPDDA